MFGSWWPHGLLHARFPCPSLSPGVCSNSCSLSPWCHPTISSSVAPFSCCSQSFQASRSFSMSWLFGSGGQSTGASTSASVLPINIQGWFPLGLTGLISLKSKWLFLWPQARILGQVAFPFSKGYSQPRYQPTSPALQVDSLPAESQGKPHIEITWWSILKSDWL